MGQRFRFCGDLDCPDRVLAEIRTLAKMSSVKLRLLCSQVLKELLGQGIDATPSPLPGWVGFQLRSLIGRMGPSCHRGRSE
uniref:Uncharacterized protein n=2 Tax=Pan TaxID=9596 RepID=A0A2I3RBS7_PANTR